MGWDALFHALVARKIPLVRVGRFFLGQFRLKCPSNCIMVSSSQSGSTLPRNTSRIPLSLAAFTISSWSHTAVLIGRHGASTSRASHLRWVPVRQQLRRSQIPAPGRACRVPFLSGLHVHRFLNLRRWTVRADSCAHLVELPASACRTHNE